MAGPRLDTPKRTPPLELLLGYGPALVLPVLAAWAWAGNGLALEAGRLWGAAILLFLVGVTRGLSFFAEGGERLGQLVAMGTRSCAALRRCSSRPLSPFPRWSRAISASRFTIPSPRGDGTAPRFFAHLRPWQMTLAIAGLVALEWRAIG